MMHEWIVKANVVFKQILSRFLNIVCLSTALSATLFTFSFLQYFKFIYSTSLSKEKKKFYLLRNLNRRLFIFLIKHLLWTSKKILFCIYNFELASLSEWSSYWIIHLNNTIVRLKHVRAWVISQYINFIILKRFESLT